MTADNNKQTSGIFASMNKENNAPKKMTPEDIKLSFDVTVHSPPSVLIVKIAKCLIFI
ncbi:MAG: hypothetical protein HQK67_12965 [Desulfamplus sp.]|nr:hypothetical protein [Desulfamplus sp.]